MNILLGDFVVRAKEQPAALFKQLSSLSVGPLVTQETGERISDHPQSWSLLHGSCKSNAARAPFS